VEICPLKKGRWKGKDQTGINSPNGQTNPEKGQFLNMALFGFGQPGTGI